MEEHKIKILLKQKEILLQKISNLEEIRTNQENEIEEQQKIIELMAKDIAEHKIDEDICRQVKDPNNEDCYDTLYYDNACSDCVIEYYEKKARENND